MGLRPPGQVALVMQFHRTQQQPEDNVNHRSYRALCLLLAALAIIPKRFSLPSLDEGLNQVSPAFTYLECGRWRGRT